VSYSNLTVQNIGDSNVTVYMTCDWGSNYTVAGWTYTWTANNTFLEPSESAVGDLDLYVPAGATPGTYSWNTFILAEQT